MLKKTLVKASFFGHGALFIFMAPSSAISTLQNSPETHIVPTVHVVPTTPADTLTAPAAPAATVPDTVVLFAPEIELNPNARKFAKQFIKKNREELQAAEQRSDRYFKIIEPIFESYGLPSELKYLAVVESQLKPSAISHAGAKGPWQLMAATARDLGLTVNGKYDERTHYTKSTKAAAKYMKQLYAQFGDWLLVVAAYNCGAGTIMKAVKTAGTSNFWKLQQYLPAETRGHVKRYIATHCFFQEKNSLTVLTKAETEKYRKAVDSFTLRQSLRLEANTVIAVR